MKESKYNEVFFKSIIDQDNCAVVICNAEHKIIYMNPAAVRNYEKSGGVNLLGASILDCHNEKSADQIKKIAEWFAESPKHNRVHTFFNERQNKDVYMIALRDSSENFIGYYEKHEFRTKDDTPMYQFV